MKNTRRSCAWRESSRHPAFPFPEFIFNCQVSPIRPTELEMNVPEEFERIQECRNCPKSRRLCAGCSGCCPGGEWSKCGAAAAPIPPHTHVFFALDDGREMRYTDIRRFGQMRILTVETRDAELGKLGLDPLEATEDEFVAKFLGRRARLKALLLDQRVLRGMGNIYTDESLFRARIHPKRLGANLSSDELHKLHRAVREVLTEAIRLRGSSISDYVDADGQRGEFQLRHRVYQREGKKCLRCGAAIQRAIVAG